MVPYIIRLYVSDPSFLIEDLKTALNKNVQLTKIIGIVNDIGIDWRDSKRISVDLHGSVDYHHVPLMMSMIDIILQETPEHIIQKITSVSYTVKRRL